MKKLLIILLTGAMLQSFSQEKGRSGSMPGERPGRLVRQVSSLKKLASQLQDLAHPGSRTMNGLRFVKTYKDPSADHGSLQGKDPVVQKSFTAGSLAPDASIRGSSIVRINTEGTSFTTVLPADPVLAAGPNHLLQMVNGSRGAYLSIMDKSGVQIIPSVFMYQLFGQSNYFGYGDPVALYDPFSKRYIISEFGSDSCATCYPNALFIGISQGTDPTAGWNLYKYSTDVNLVDFPKLAAWPNALYATTNDFNTTGSTYLGTSIYAFDKLAMARGASSVNIQRTRIKATGYNKYLSLAPVNISGGNLQDPQSPGLFIYFHDDNRTEDPSDADSLGLFSYAVNFKDPSASSFQLVGKLKVAPFKSRVCNGNKNCVASAGGEGYDEISDRIMHKVYYREFDSYQSIVLNHTVDASYPWGDPQAGLRWYELRNHNGQWSVFQQSTFAPSKDGRFMGAININQKGQIVLAYNLSGPSKYASLFFTGRNITDAENEMSYTETLLAEGDGYGTQGYRWGDYSDLVVDPVDDSTFWFCGMYGSTNWKTRIAAIKLGTLKTNPEKVSISQVLIPGRICDAFISPTIKLNNQSTDTVSSLSMVLFIDEQKIDSLRWEGTLIPGALLDIHPAMTYPASAGNHKMMVYLYREQPGTNAELIDSLVTSFTSFELLKNNYSESFEGKDPAKNNFSIEPFTGLSWAKNTLAATDGRASLVIKNQVSNSSGLKSSLVLPPMQFQDQPDSIYVSMDIAYPGSLPGASNDSLEILVAAPCDSNYRVLYRNWGNGLKTTMGSVPVFNTRDTTGYVPDQQDWKPLRVNISDSIGVNEAFQLIIRVGSNKGHNLYLDKINVYGLILPGNLKEKGYLVYPNPARDMLIIRHWNTPVDLKNIGIYNQAGQQLLVRSYQGNASRELQFAMGAFPAGIYQVKLTYTRKVITERIIKLK